MPTVLSRKPGGSSGGGGGGGAPSGPAGGDLTGTYPNPSLKSPITHDQEFDSALTVEPVADVTALTVTGQSNAVDIRDGAGNIFQMGSRIGFSLGSAQTFYVGDGVDNILQVESAGEVGFFGVTPDGQPAAPTTINEVVSALQTLGLVDT